ncbi:hypothetical protein FRB99_004681, partial [Tulasnella sp. 403]
MWVIKPVLEQEMLDDSSRLQDEYQSLTHFPFPLPVSSQIILCRICEIGIPEWFFEKHNETCAESHRLEAAITECNESIQELRRTLQNLQTFLDRDRERLLPTPLGTTALPPTPPPPPAEYRGMPIFTSGATPSSPGLSLSSPLQIFRPQLGSKKKKRVQGVKMHKALLQALDDILVTTLDIAMPALKEDQANQPIERQRLLSPESEQKIEVVSQWKRPSAFIASDDDAAVLRLVQDVEMLIRSKLDNVKRLENTILYSEKIRQEWEEMVQRAMSLDINGPIQEEDEEEEEEPEQDQEDADRRSHSSTRSVYADDGREEAPSASADPTPIGSSSPARTPSVSSRKSAIAVSNVVAATTVTQGLGLSHSSTTPSTTPPATSVPIPTPPVVPATWQGIGFSHTRSSTPSSISSPLALAAPIVASPDAVTQLHHPIPHPASQHLPTQPISTQTVLGPSPGPVHVSPLQLEKPDTVVESSSQTIRARPSGTNLVLLEQQ